MKLKRRFPNYFSGFEETEHEVNSYDDLMNIGWVKNITHYKFPGDDFVRLAYSPSSSPEYPSHLMAVNEKSFWVVGYIYGNPEELGLTEWKG